MNDYIKAAAQEYLKVLLARPFARIFWRRAVKKAVAIANLMDGIVNPK